MSFQCTQCLSSIDPSSVDEARQIATCGSCGRIVDLQPQFQRSSSEPAPAPRLRGMVELPAGMAMRRWWEGTRTEGDPGGLEIKRRWLRTKHFAFLAVAVCAAAGVAYLWTNGVEPAWLSVVGTLFVVSFAFRLVPMFVNTTTIRVWDDRVEVRHGPVPSLLFRDRTVTRAELKQLYAAKWGALYEVGAELGDGSKVSLIRPLVSEEQALFVEQQIERQLGIVDIAVEGELGAANLPTGKPAAVSSGAGATLAVVPLIVIVSVFLFFSALSSSTEGSFELAGQLGDQTFAPDHCASGQLDGFFGVALTSEASPGLVVRAMRDPTRGTLIAVQRNGHKPVVLSPEECTSLQVNVSRTSTNVNDVWAVRGSASADCPGLKGSVTFDGCHH